MRTSNILLLTATITPKPGVPNLSRVNPQLRLQDYQRALEFYLSMVNVCCEGIVFAENSNSDVSNLQQLVSQYGLSDRVEFLVFDGLDYPSHYDRGYGEFKLIDHAMSHSKMIRKGDESQDQSGDERTVIWKITGRYIVKNLIQIILCQPPHFDVYCNCRNYPKHWVDTYFIAWTSAAYETCFRDIYHRLKTNVPGIPAGLSGEELLRSWLDQKLLREHMQFVRRFRVTPDIEGIRGADNRDYSTDDGWKIRLRATLNRTIPWLWI
jgi:hypothetical protein